MPAIASYARADSSEMGVAGDSRAVLSRAGMAIPLTDDHKAAREDETVCFGLLLYSNLRQNLQISLEPEG